MRKIWLDEGTIETNTSTPSTRRECQAVRDSLPQHPEQCLHCQGDEEEVSQRVGESCVEEWEQKI